VSSEPGAEWCGGWWRDATRVASPNFSARPADARVDGVVLHSISLPPGEYGGDGIRQLFTNTLDWSAHPYYETIRGLEVSAHFVVRRDGAVLQFVSIDDRAWHAGRSNWAGRDECNDWTIGIELEGLEGDTFEPAQYAALERLLPAIDRNRAIRHVVGHEHVAPGRKIDPGPGFDWPGLAARLRWDAARIPPARPRDA
jgi:AmpD protein